MIVLLRHLPHRANLASEEREAIEAFVGVLKAAADMATHFAQYSEATLAAQIAVPVGTSIPVMMLGAQGEFGPAWGPCGRLIAAEAYRLAPERSDGIGRFVLPWAQPSSEQTRGMPSSIRPGIDELVAADNAIVAEIEGQIQKLNNQAQRAAGMIVDDREDAAA